MSGSGEQANTKKVRVIRYCVLYLDEQGYTGIVRSTPVNINGNRLKSDYHVSHGGCKIVLETAEDSRS